MGLPLDFAFEGFRLIRARPRLIALWGIITLFGYGIAFLMYVATTGPILPTITAAGLHPSDTISETLAPRLMMMMLSVTPLCWLTQAVLACAVCRAGLEGGQDPFGFVRFGVREMQVLAVMAVTSLLTFAVLLSVLSVCQSLSPSPAFAAIGLVLGLLAAFSVGIRLSLNVPQTFVQRRIDLFGSVSLTRGRFWPLAGGYVMAFALSAIVQYLGQQVVRAIVGVCFGDSVAKAAYDLSSLSAFLTPANTIDVAISFGLIMPQVAAILLAAPLGAWKALKPSPAEITVVL
ncbi:MAG: hypothetical protein JF571_08525 [Asticcacaulis sp.]|nr:hypothetical protein [Asticcacaulis sp.]